MEMSVSKRVPDGYLKGEGCNMFDIAMDSI